MTRTAFVRRRTPVVLAALAAVVALTGTGAVVAHAGQGRYRYDGHPTDETVATRTVLFVGDSVLDQASGPLKALGTQRGNTLDIWAVPGAAACDFLGGYKQRLTTTKPDEVSFSFAGNATSACMQKYLGGRPPGTLSQAQQDAIARKYYLDLRSLVRTGTAQGVRTWLVLPMQNRAGTWHGQVTDELIVRMQQLDRDYPSARIDSGPRDLLTPGGTFRATLRFGGVDHPLRYKDGTHLRLPYGSTLWAEAALASTAQAPR
ncbi:MAG: hypothetical protein JWN87_1724 [Frankiales bacterium]|nr:hypothetical protein [Frankiales bacterium]